MSGDSIKNRIPFRLSAMLIVCCVVSLCFFAWRLTHLTIEDVLHLWGANSNAESAVIVEYGNFNSYLIHLQHSVFDDFYDNVAEFRSEPPDTLREYFEISFPGKTSTFGTSGMTGFSHLMKGIDPWGTRFIYEKTKFGERCYQITLRSCGPDGIDNKGGGDDLERSFDLYIVVDGLPPDCYRL